MNSLPITAFGGLGRIPPVANHVVACFMKRENYSNDEYFCLKYFFVTQDFSELTQDTGRLEWFKFLSDGLNAIDP